MKARITKIPMQQLASGDTLHLLAYQFIGKPGPKVYIQANVHGPEIAGCAVISELVKVIEKEATINGSITLIPSANLVGLNTKIGRFPVGYINLNGDSTSNWNRIFFDLTKTFDIQKFVKNNLHLALEKLICLYEEKLNDNLNELEQGLVKYGINIEKKLALTLQKLLVKNDYVIDLHSAGLNQPHVYTFPGLTDSARFFGIQHVLKLPLEFTGAFDEAFYLPWAKLKDYYKGSTNKDLGINKEVYTVELENDNETDSLKTKKYVDMILNFLKSKDILKGKVKSPRLKFWVCKSSDYVKYFAPIGGLVEPLVGVGQKVKKGLPLVKITSPSKPLTEETIIAQEDCVINSFPLSKVVFEGEPVIGILKSLKEVKS